MKANPKVQIYKGMIQYLLESTHYTLKSIADLSDSSIKNIRTIYCEELLPLNFSSELQLVKLYHVILELNLNGLHDSRGC
ncbi:MAG: hypothetical protein NTU48_07015 [Legionellales bacterium]|nr:hypothetical protein [Legionellales bacterium]